MSEMSIQPPSLSPIESGDGLKQKSDIHFGRKIWHCIGICLITAGYNFGGIKLAWGFAAATAIIFIPLDILRLKNPAINRFALRVFGPVMRRHERTHISGMTYLFIACMFLFWMNSKYVVTLSLLFLGFADPIASFFGIRYGKERLLGNKTLEGTMAAFFVCTLIAGLYYYFNNLMTERLLIVVPVSGLIGALAELVPIGKIDDNFTFPVVAACLLWVLFKVYGGFAI